MSPPGFHGFRRLPPARAACYKNPSAAYESPAMPRYEYKVVPAPTRGLKAKGIRGPEARFSHAIQELMNGLSGYGWEYQRAETLPSIERSGLTGSTTEWRNVLIFRRLREDDTEAFAPELLSAPEEQDVSAEINSENSDDPVSEPSTETSEKSSKDGVDNGVEDTSEMAGIGGALRTLAAKRKPRKTDD